MKLIYSIIFLALGLNLLSQRSKDGAVTISTANTVVNAYTSLTADAIGGVATISVANSASFNVGDLILIIQMQGARVNAQWDTVWVDPNNSMSVPNSNNIDFGSIKNYHNTGNNEFAEIISIPNGTSIVLDCNLKNDYTYSYINNQGGSHTMFGRVQVIKVPRYSSLTISGGGSITCPQWNGSTGGIAVVEVENNTTLSSTPSFNVSGKGFRGGIKDNASSVFGGNKWGALNHDQGGYKGESIFGDSTVCKDYAALIGRGAIANGGGGGDAHNAGGGGGGNGGVVASYNGYGNPAAGYTTQWNLEGGTFSANLSSGGGRGGYTFSNQNKSVTTVAPGAISTTTNTWSGDMRRNAGGLGGRPLDYSSGRIYLGGGGGAGDGNENQAGAGGNGGGLVYLVCYGDLSGAGTIIADGSNGLSSSAGCTSNDGAGGGGGGGTILLKVNGITSLTAPTVLSAIGGNGGNVVFNCLLTNSDGYGPGGSGGGGYIATTGALPANTVNAGINGIQTGNTSNISVNFPPNGATKGGLGSTGSLTSYTLNTSTSQTICANQSFTVTSSSTQPGTSINWYNTSIGGTSIATGTAYASPGYTTAGTYTLFAGACPGTYRQPITITVSTGLNITVNSPTICPNQTVTLTANGATTYTWNTGPTTNTISVFPSSTTIYTINGTTGLCNGTQTATVTVSSAPSVSVTNATICAGSSVTLTASGATTYTWLPSGSGTSIVVTPTSTAIYTVTGSNGSCTSLPQTSTVTVNSIPVVTLTPSTATICSGQTTTLTASGAASYIWLPAGSGTSSAVTPTSTTIYTVTGSNGSCVSSPKNSTVTVNSIPIVTLTPSSPTICSGQTTTLTAGGAASYTWLPTGSGTSSALTPTSTTIYTVTGSTGSCVSLPQTSTVTVNSIPVVTLTPSSPTICAGQTTTLTAGGAASYTWLPTGSGTSSAVSPTTTTVYTITGSTGSCISLPQTSTVTVNTTPIVTLTPTSVAICEGQTTTLNASGASSYTWLPSGSGTSSVVSPTATTVYTVTGSNASCISLPQTSTITVNAIPIITLTPSFTAICSGQTTILTASGAATYTWLPSGSGTSSAVTPASSTIYTVTGSIGICTNSITSSVSVTPTPTLTPFPTTICAGQTATLTGNGATTFTWLPGNVTGNTYTISPPSTTTVSLIGANGTCTTQITDFVTIGTGVSIAVTGATICPGQTGILTANSVSTYTWSNGLNTNTIAVSPLVTTTYTVDGTIGSCSGTNTVELTVIAQPTLAITGNTSICSGSSTTLTANGTSTSYTWQSGGQTTNTISVNPNSTTIYTVTGSNSVCTNSITTTVSVTPTPTITGVSDTQICAAQTATFTASGAASFTWQPNNFVGATYTIAPSSNTTISVIGANGTCTSQATAFVTIGSGVSVAVNSETICAGQTATLSALGITTYTWSNGSNTSSITVSPTSTTVYTISGNNGSCSGTSTSTVTVNAVPIITLTPSFTAICSGQTTILTATGATSYTWSNGINGNSQTVSPTSTTVYTVLGTDGNGCINSSIATTTVNFTATPTISVNSPSICAGQTATLTATGATSYTWSTTQNSATTTPSPTTTTTYSVTGDNNGCTSTNTATVTVDNTVLITNTFSVATCPSQTVAIIGAGTNSTTTTYTWSNGISSYSQTVAPINTTTYVVNGNSLSGCPAISGTVIVNVNSISANFNGINSNIMTVGETLNLTNSSIGETSILWDYCGGTSVNNQISIPLSDTGTCCIKLVAINTVCKDSATKCVMIVNPAVVSIPNVFTPNGDTKNDEFKINSVGLKSLSCTIFDRWGLKMYEWEGIKGFWDGNTKTGAAPSGTYFYILTYTDQKDKSTTEKGFLTLFKD
jgi:gliding motility-associated-like protein